MKPICECRNVACSVKIHFLLKEEKGNFASSKGNNHTPFSCILHSNNELSLTGEKNTTPNDQNSQVNYTAMISLGLTWTSNKRWSDILQLHVKCKGTRKSGMMFQVTLHDVSEIPFESEHWLHLHAVRLDVNLLLGFCSAAILRTYKAQKRSWKKITISVPLRDALKQDKSAVKNMMVDSHTN